LAPFDAIGLALAAIFSSGQPAGVSVQTVQVPPAIVSEPPQVLSRPVIVVDSNQAQAPEATDTRWSAPAALAPVTVVTNNAQPIQAPPPVAQTPPQVVQVPPQVVQAPPVQPQAIAPALPAKPAVVRVVPETPMALRAWIAQSAGRHGLPSDVLSAALARESGNFRDRWVYGYHEDGSGRGIAGIDKRFHPEVSDEQAFNPQFAIEWEAALLAQLRAKNNGDLFSALREYNGGFNFDSGRIGYGGQTVANLTRAHADTIMAHAARAVPLPVA